jgi:opacity protein-like surface antigen
MFFILFSAKAFAGEGPYLGFQVSSVFLDDVSLPPAIIPGEMRFDTGMGLGATLGYDFGMFRLEGEFGYRRNDVDGTFIAGVASLGEIGKVNAWSFMLNGFLDIETGTILTPYLGGGIGLANIDWDKVSIGFTPDIDDDDTVFAYQFGAGVGIAINESVNVDIGYRYFATADPSLVSSFVAPGQEFDFEYASHNISLGIRVTF